MQDKNLQFSWRYDFDSAFRRNLVQKNSNFQVNFSCLNYLSSI